MPLVSFPTQYHTEYRSEFTEKPVEIEEDLLVSRSRSIGF